MLDDSYLKQDEILWADIRKGLEQLNQQEDTRLWRFFIGENLLKESVDFQDRDLFWHNINIISKSKKKANDLKKYVKLISKTFIKESLRDRMTLLVKKNVLWRKGGEALFESLAYDFEKDESQFFNDENNLQSLLLVYFDLDYFKGYNELFGHVGGDLVLKRLSHFLLSEYENKGITVVRIAGEEIFLLFKGNIDEKKVNQIVEELHRKLQNLFKRLFYEIGQLYDSSFSEEEAISFIEGQVENYILLCRALEIDAEFSYEKRFAYQKELLEKQDLLIELINEDDSNVLEKRIKVLEAHLAEQTIIDEANVNKKNYYKNRELFWRDYSLIEEVKEYFLKYNINKVEDLSPSRFLLVLKSLRASTNPRLRTEFSRYYNDMKCSIGGVTIGALHLKMNSEDRELLVETKILNQIQVLFKYLLMDKTDVMDCKFILSKLNKKNLTYNELYYLIFKYIDKDFQRVTVQLINKVRFDKLLNKVTHLEEDQKHQERNKIKYEFSSLKKIEEMLSSDDLGLDINNDLVFQRYQSLKDGIDHIVQYYLSQMRLVKESPVNKWWTKITTKTKAMKNFDHDFLTKQYGIWQNVFKYRYFDALLGIYNDQYLLDFEKNIYWNYKQYNIDYTVVALDFDNLKAVNEAVDHYCGDVVLMETVILLNLAFRNWARANNLKESEYPRIIRTSPGEEFVIIFPSLDAKAVKIILDSITSQVTERIQTWLKEVGVFVDIQKYLFTKMDKKGEELNHIATFTSGIVNAKNYYHKAFNLDDIKKLADKIGENGKTIQKGQNYLDI